MNRILNIMAPEEKLAESITVQAAEDKDCDEIAAWAQERTGGEISGLRQSVIRIIMNDY